MRPKKTRWVKCDPGERCFRPRCQSPKNLEIVFLTLDEFEAIRLGDFEKLEQVEAAQKMRISRPTFSRILSSARNKLADGLVSIKEIRVEGGCCQFKERKRK